MTNDTTNRGAQAVARAQEQTKQALENLRDELASGKSETLLALLRAFGTFHDYSLRNTMLIVSQKPDATRVAGFWAWKKLGRSVRKGERGLVILAPMRRKLEEHEHDDDQKAKQVRGFRAVHVFDMSQTEGEPLPEPQAAAGDPGESLQRLREFVEAAGIRVTYEDDLGGAFGKSSGGEIVVRSGLAPAEEFATLVHELAHELLHQVVPVAERPEYRVRETEAEAVAFAVCDAVGLDAVNAARDYIHFHDGDAEALAASFERVHGVSTRIVGFLRQGPGAEDAEAPGALAA